MASQSSGQPIISSLEDYRPSPHTSYAYWRDELRGSQHMLRAWHRSADRWAKRYLDERAMQGSTLENRYDGRRPQFRLNLFYSNVQVIHSLLYGQIPKVDVKRRYSDSSDDIGRVASVILERLLNNDMADRPTQYDAILTTVLEDRLVPGLGVARVRYEVDTEDNTVTDERAPLDYVHWRDVLWSWCRTPDGLRWQAFRSWVTKDEATERYGKKTAENLQYKRHKQTVGDEDSPQSDATDDDYWMKAEIWEIWCKETRQVYEFSFGCGTEKLLAIKDDPFQLRNFFPAPCFFMANPTSSIYKPQPDAHLVQDLYNEIDKLQTRIAIITEAVKVVGVYDASATEIKRMLKEGVENDLIPVDKWALFAEKGGLQGQIDWFPLQDVVAALLQLRELRDETIELLYQVSGMADVMRGVLSNQYEGVKQTGEKVKFGSVRIQKLHEAFARFVSELLAIKAELIAKHFSPETIIRLSNADTLPEDPELLAQAVGLIKDWPQARLRVSVKAESLALSDYTQMQEERTAVLTGLGGFLQAASPLIEQAPATGSYLLRMLQWALTGFRGADEIEGVLDQAIEAQMQAEQQQRENPTPNPEAEREQARAQGQVMVIQAKQQADMQLREQDKQADIETRMAEHQGKLQEMEADLIAEITKIRAKAEADMTVATHDAQANAEQSAMTIEAELNKDTVEHTMELEKLAAQTASKIREMRENTAGKIQEARAKPTPGGDSDG